jgi:hypothetical protein
MNMGRREMADFADRYMLGQGYPVLHEYSPRAQCIGLTDNPAWLMPRLSLAWPQECEYAIIFDVPYRLVLERADLALSTAEEHDAALKACKALGDIPRGSVLRPILETLVLLVNQYRGETYPTLDVRDEQEPGRCPICASELDEAGVCMGCLAPAEDH